MATEQLPREVSRLSRYDATRWLDWSVAPNPDERYPPHPPRERANHGGDSYKLVRLGRQPSFTLHYNHVVEFVFSKRISATK